MNALPIALSCTASCSSLSRKVGSVVTLSSSALVLAFLSLPGSNVFNLRPLQALAVHRCPEFREVRIGISVAVIALLGKGQPKPFLIHPGAQQRQQRVARNLVEHLPRRAAWSRQVVQ